MKPKNFPERKRIRRIGALKRLAPMTQGNQIKGTEPSSNKEAAEVLKQRVLQDMRGVKTKKDRTDKAKFFP